MKKMMMIVSVGLMSTTLFVGCQNVSPENKRIGSAAIGGGAGGAVGKGLGGNIGAGLGAAQHRRVRWRSGQRHRVGSVRRWQRGLGAPRAAGRERPVPPCDRAESGARRGAYT